MRISCQRAPPEMAGRHNSFESSPIHENYRASFRKAVLGNGSHRNIQNPYSQRAGFEALAERSEARILRTDSAIRRTGLLRYSSCWKYQYPKHVLTVKWCPRARHHSRMFGQAPAAKQAMLHINNAGRSSHSLPKHLDVCSANSFSTNPIACASPRPSHVGNELYVWRIALCLSSMETNLKSGIVISITALQSPKPDLSSSIYTLLPIPCISWSLFRALSIRRPRTLCRCLLETTAAVSINIPINIPILTATGICVVVQSADHLLYLLVIQCPQAL